MTKTQVWELSKHLNVIDEIIKAKPTDGLWEDGRSDEDQIGASYSELEWAMNYIGNTDNLTERKTEVLAIYKKLNAINQHKMVPIPVCLIPKELI